MEILQFLITRVLDNLSLSNRRDIFIRKIMEILQMHTIYYMFYAFCACITYITILYEENYEKFEI